MAWMHRLVLIILLLTTAGPSQGVETLRDDLESAHCAHSIMENTNNACPVTLVPLHLLLPSNALPPSPAKHVLFGSALANGVVSVETPREKHDHHDRAWSSLAKINNNRRREVWGAASDAPCSPEAPCIHLVPHTHLDPGWRSTFDAYYRSTGVAIHIAVVAALARDPRRRFTFADTAFLVRWLEVGLVVVLTPGCHSIGYMDVDHTGCHRLNRVLTHNNNVSEKWWSNLH
jgi:hypothetical protein